MSAFLSGERDQTLGLLGHPEYNKAFMQNLVISDYFKRGKITPEENQRAYYLAQAETQADGGFDETAERLRVWEAIEGWLLGGKGSDECFKV